MRSAGMVVLVLLALGGCGRGADPAGDPASQASSGATSDAVASETPLAASTMPAASPSAASPVASLTPVAMRSCSAEIGAAAAARRVAVCRNVSPATHPPCNAANSCALIEDEIARSCALFDDKGPPMQGCASAPRGMQAAADVVRRYYSALDARDFGTAWSQWGEGGQPGQTFAAFKDGFAHTSATRVTIGTMEPGSGGAGSIYQPVPVIVEATRDDGTQQRFTGSYTVRRVNGVDGASAAQLRWHLDSAQLHPVPVG